MSWYNKIDRIVCLNLAKREDRLLQFVEQAEKYNLPFERIEAVHDQQQGARGLRDTMVLLFMDAIEKGTSEVLVFEDDALFVQEPHIFADTMEKVVEQLPEGYHLCFLGCQLSHRISHFHSPNLFPVTMAFSTHAVLWSLEGMKQCVERMEYPIDNWMVKEIEPLGKCYCVYPLLASQVPGHSDIGHAFIDWNPFISTRYDQKMTEYRLGMR